MSGLGPAACWLAHKRLESWSRIAKERVGAVRKSDKSEDEKSSASTTHRDSNSVSSSLEECNVIREPHAIQPVSSVPAHTVNTEHLRGPLEVTPSPLHSYLQHQSKSFPPRLQRTPSVSSQSSLDSAPSRQSGHRGSSPQIAIRAYGPDGRTATTSEHSSLQCPRSPSPMRAISLDARCSSPSDSDIRTTSPSQSSLASLASGSACGSSICLSPKLGRCLSPLLIPPRTPAGIDPGCGPASPLGALQPDLYQRPDGPIYLTAPENSVALGKLHLRIRYDSHLFDLAVHLIEAHNLCPIEEGGFRDPYVRLQLEPEVDTRKRQTAIHRGEAHPYFDQNFKFPVSRDQLQGKELILQVLDYDRYSHNDIIGEVRIGIDELDLSKSVEIWGDLIRMKKPPEDRPELLISLTYLPQAERLTFNIMKAKNLNTHHEPWVRIYHIVNGKRVKKRKTATLKFDDVQNPLWNESYSFSMPQSIMQTTAFEIYLVTSGGESNAISCGIGPEETGSGKQHWIDILHNPRKPIAMWHYLR
ncbi:synaptotagmin-5 [Bradysia coprophila]|uniref:synaptotagmin-5 n=1 Tax=Bradysia coprophila TaxID=38358 RepID=UPI00187DC2A2|nr:synaptotagmin-5 [Bradysia coprophila]